MCLWISNNNYLLFVITFFVITLINYLLFALEIHTFFFKFSKLIFVYLFPLTVLNVFFNIYKRIILYY